MITPRLSAIAVHALLDDDPAATIGDDEAVEIEIEAVLDGRTIDLRDQPARPGQGCPVNADAITNRHKLLGRGAAVPLSTAADVNAELARQWRRPALQGADDTGGDAGRMPIHAHHCPEGLESEGMSEAPEQLVTAIFEDDRLHDDCAERVMRWPSQAGTRPP
jgi:hypothetical protein